MNTIDPDHVSPDSKLRVQSPTDLHEVTGEWWNTYVTKAKLAGVALVNRIVDVLEQGTLPRPGEQSAQPAPAVDAPPADTPPPVDTPPAPAGQ